MKKHTIKALAIIGIISFHSLARADLNDGLVAYYPFNWNANDESGNGNNAIIKGVTLTSDRFGNPNSAFMFDGRDDYIEVTNSPSLEFDINTDVTLSAWIKQGTNISGDQHLFDQRVGSGAGLGYGLLMRDGLVVFALQGGSGVHYESNLGIVANTTWHNVVLVMTRSPAEVIIFIDGVQSTPETFTNYDFSNSGSLIIGARFSKTTFFSGLIDDIRIYKRALNESEIQELYNEGSAPNENGTGFSYDVETDQPYSGIDCEASYNAQSQILQTPCLKIIGNNVLSDTFYGISMKLAGSSNSVLEFQIDESSINEIPSVQIESDNRCLPTFNIDNSELAYGCLLYSPDALNVFRFNTLLNIDLQKGKAYVKPEEIIEVDSLKTDFTSFQETTLYKAIQNKNFYPEHYNKIALANEERRRLYLWIWQTLLRPKFYLETSLATKNIDDIESSHDFIQQALDIADTLVSVTSMSKDISKIITNPENVPFSYSISKVAGVATDGCSLLVKIGDATGIDQKPETGLCSPVLNVLNQKESTNTVMDAVNPIAAGFIPKLIPALIISVPLLTLPVALTSPQENS